MEHKGKAVELIDTAGWVEKAAYDRFDDAGGRVAGQGVRKAERSMEQSAVAVLVVDARHVADEGFALR